MLGEDYMDNVWFAVFAIFLLGLSLRTMDLGTGLTTDEILWIDRAPNFIEAILSHQWDETYKVPHPGVITMWLSGISIKTFDGSDFPAKLAFARAPTAIVTSLSIMLIFYFIRILFNTKIALLSATLIALDPFLLAHSRLIHLDAMLTTFMLLCLLSIMSFFKKPRKEFLIMAGILLGLAILTKLPAIFLLAFIPFIVFFLSNNTKVKSFSYIFIIIIVAAMTFFLLWPSMWFSPIDTIMKMAFDQQSGLEVVVKNPHGSGFFRGVIDDGSHGPLFYPVSFLMMETPITLLFLPIFFIIFIKKLFANGLDYFNKNLVALCLYITLFAAQMMLSLKAFPRYILPVFPVIDIIVAIGMYCSFKEHINKNSVFYLLMGGIIFVQLGLIMPISPYFLSYTNPVVFGGPSNAPDMILMGWGEGNDLAASYLNQKPNAKNLNVAVDYYGFTQYFIGKTTSLNESVDFIDGVDYIVFYISALQRNWSKDAWEYYKTKEPEKVIILNGIDYCYIYKTDKQ
ncbi:MAG: glycosyltransferase family 39 protein [Methanothrix soehngenii]|jgi:4-amino-4-deoxy-L-arabinose transferase-like glycosyltransferase